MKSFSYCMQLFISVIVECVPKDLKYEKQYINIDCIFHGYKVELWLVNNQVSCKSIRLMFELFHVIYVLFPTYVDV